jgi:hypothetical protein
MLADHRDRRIGKGIEIERLFIGECAPAGAFVEHLLDSYEGDRRHEFEERLHPLPYRSDYPGVVLARAESHHDERVAILEAMLLRHEGLGRAVSDQMQAVPGHGRLGP